MIKHFELSACFIEMLNFARFYFTYFDYSNPLAVEKRQALE